jgi:hypothetical protein
MSAVPTTINAWADFVLNGENAQQLIIAEPRAIYSSGATPLQQSALPLQRPHYITFSECIDEEMIHKEIIDREQ